jgi:glutamate-5-semialdehyde dehydrogenase
MSPAASAIADNELQGLMRRFGEQAVAAQATLARSTSASRDAALREAACAVRRQTADILAANAEDMADGEQKGLSAISSALAASRSPIYPIRSAGC